MQWGATKISFKSNIQAGILALILVACTGLVQAKSLLSDVLPFATSDTVTVSDLPVQGQQMLTLIVSGGPFSHEKDGVVFGNRERILPAAKRGYYREYTVKTPRARNRGAKRIVCGGYQMQMPDVCYYTDDHYASFRKIIR